MNLNINKCKCNYEEFIIAGRSTTRQIIICDCKCGTSKYELIEFIPKKAAAQRDKKEGRK